MKWFWAFCHCRTEKIQTILNRPILKFDALPIAHFEAYVPNFLKHLWKLAIWGDIWKHTVGKSETNAASVTLPALSQVLWGDIWRGTVQCRKEKREKSTFVIFSRCSERMCPLENLFFREKRYAGQTSTWWLMGKNIAQSSSLVWFVSSSFSSAALLITTLFLSCSSTSLPILSSSIHWVELKKYKGTKPFITANHTEYDQFCTLDVVQNSENETWEQWKRNMKYGNWEISGETGERRVDKLAVHEWTNWRCS